MNRSDVVVVGGGFAGMAAAAAFAAKGASVTVLELHQGHDPRFRGELIHPRGVRGLDELGLKVPLFRAGGVGVRGFAVCPEAATPGGVSEPLLLPYAEEWGEGLGIEHHLMVDTLRERVKNRPGVTLVQGQPVTELLFEHGEVVGARLRNGAEYRSHLLVGADGRQSRVRKLLGLEPEVRLLSYTVAVTVEGPKLPWASHGHVFLGAPGPVLAYPFGDERIRMCIDVPLSAPKGKDGMLAYIREHYAPVVPQPLREAMLQSLEQHPFEGCANHAIYTEACATPGAALVGDAGGCSHPLTATGMTAAINDVLLLAALVGTRGPTERSLLEYQRQRYRFVRAREVFTEALYEVFRAQDPGAKALTAGTFRYWRSNERARTASMGILSGEDSRPITFLGEYTRVLGLSAADVWWQPRLFGLRTKSRHTSALLKTSLTRLRRSVSRSWQTLQAERKMTLPSLPAMAAPPSSSSRDVRGAA